MIAPFDERETIDKGFMHYYQFNIGDYASHTRHLDLLEDLAYRRILDLYYLHEKPLEDVSPVIAKKIGMKEHAELVSSVLQEFFVLTDQGWVNPRADKEIAHYKSKVEQASRAGKASAERRFNGRSTDSATDVQPNNKHKPITNNKDKEENTFVGSKLPDCPHEKILALYAEHLPVLPQPRIWNDKRRKLLAARWKFILTNKNTKDVPFATDEESGLAFFNKYFSYVAGCDFLVGKSTAWNCDLPWLLQAENFAKVIEGNYQNKVAA